MRNWSIPAGHLFGVDFRIHLTFFFLLFFVLVAEPTSPHTPAASLRGAALVGIIFVCVVIHELAHILLSAKTGVQAKTVILLPIGGVTLMDEMRQATLTSGHVDARDMDCAGRAAGQSVDWSGCRSGVLALDATGATIVQTLYLFLQPAAQFCLVQRGTGAA